MLFKNWRNNFNFGEFYLHKFLVKGKTLTGNAQAFLLPNPRKLIQKKLKKNR